MKRDKKDFEKFKAEFLRFVEIFGLKDYSLYFELKDLEGHYAEINYDIDVCTATIFMNGNISDNDYKDFDPVRCGKHEAIHLLFARLRSLGSRRFTTSQEIDTEDERITVILENTIE